MRIVDYVTCPQNIMILDETKENTFTSRGNYKVGISGLCAGLSIGMLRYILNKTHTKSDVSAVEAFGFANEYIYSLFGVKNVKEMTSSEQMEKISNYKSRGENYILIETELERLHRRQKEFYKNQIPSDMIGQGGYILPIKITQDSRIGRHAGAIWISKGKKSMLQTSLHSLCIYEPNCGLYLVEYGKGGELKAEKDDCANYIKKANEFLKGRTPKSINEAVRIFYKSLGNVLRESKYEAEDQWYRVDDSFSLM